MPASRRALIDRVEIVDCNALNAKTPNYTRVNLVVQKRTTITCDRCSVNAKIGEKKRKLAFCDPEKV
ncbi:MAG TPA: hypothetical protein VI306_08950 [Pyrinomonadaceae bacterium]